MKTLTKYLVLLLMVSILMTSCKTNEKFYVNSPVDATIYLPSQLSAPYNKVKGGSSAKIEIPSDGYWGYIVLKDNQTGLDIPVGMNVHYRSNIIPRTLTGTGYGLTIMGISGLIAGTVLVAAAGEDDDSLIGVSLVGGGAGASVIGLALGMPAQSRLKQLSYEYQFAYDKNQNVNISGLSTKLLREDFPKEVTEIQTSPKRKKATSGESTVSVINSSKAKKSRGDLANNVVGTYQGTGNLLNGNITEELYNDIQVIIKRIDKTHVSVTVIENGEDFFESPLKYEISSKGKTGYRLTLDKLQDACIEISKTGLLTFIHKKVNIDNDIYTLSIKGKKK